MLGVFKLGSSVILSVQTSLLALPEFVPPGFRCGLEILNDNGTPTEFVVSALSTHLGINHKDSVRTMLSIHSRGGALLPMSSMEEASKAAQAITAEAAGHNYPLVCRSVEIAG
jgi:ATP-dependent Clp protease adapter protein ClpS